jgi:hypothetical protein
MKVRMSWVLCGGMLVVSASMAMAACGSSGGGTGGTAGSAGNAGSKGTSGTKGTSGSGGASGGGGTAGTGGTTGTAGTGGTAGSSGDGGSECGTTSSLHVEMEAGIYCPFSSVGDAGDKTCTGGEVCCQTLSADAGTSTCEPAGTVVTACPAPTESVVWECEDPIDCIGNSGGAVCCGFGTPTQNPGCSNYSYVSGAKGKGSVCASSCSGGFIICETQTECTAADAGTCTPVKYHGNAVGFCL